MSFSIMTSIKLFIILIVIYFLKTKQIKCDKTYSGESKKVLNILSDLQTDASHPHPHYGIGPASHEGHGSGHDHWDNFDKLWENSGGAHHSEYDKYGNNGYKGHYLDINNGYHDRHNDGIHSGNYEDYNDKSLWSRDRGHDHERDMKWDRELEIKKANAGKSDIFSKYHNMDNGAHYGHKQLNENRFDNYGGRGRDSGHGWRELDRVKHLNGAYNHDSGYSHRSPPLHYH